eukprot:m.185990 g.185990  ORF g.185990 m.185990 type:complete len:230 (+) comp14745_c0_seq5:145-834(+)
MYCFCVLCSILGGQRVKVATRVRANLRFTRHLTLLLGSSWHVLLKRFAPISHRFFFVQYNVICFWIIEMCVESALEAGYVRTGTIAQDIAQQHQLWSIRESVPEALKRSAAHVFKYDISLPLPDLYGLVEATRTRVSDVAKHCVGYGHIGDGNVHLNVAADEDVRSLIEPFVYEYTAAHGGSVSAEHGIGQLKAEYLSYSKNDVAVDVMKQIKGLLDPQNTLNPYKMLR